MSKNQSKDLKVLLPSSMQTNSQIAPQTLNQNSTASGNLGGLPLIESNQPMAIQPRNTLMNQPIHPTQHQYQNPFNASILMNQRLISQTPGVKHTVFTQQPLQKANPMMMYK
eukprot:Platyproteum_vivax@DN8682_c0_g1_i1.p1